MRAIERNLRTLRYLTAQKLELGVRVLLCSPLSCLGGGFAMGRSPLCAVLPTVPIIRSLRM